MTNRFNKLEMPPPPPPPPPPTSPPQKKYDPVQALKVTNTKLATDILENTVELQWLEHIQDYENMFQRGVVRANEC